MVKSATLYFILPSIFVCINPRFFFLLPDIFLLLFLSFSFFSDSFSLCKHNQKKEEMETNKNRGTTFSMRKNGGRKNRTKIELIKNSLSLSSHSFLSLSSLFSLGLLSLILLSFASFLPFFSLLSFPSFRKGGNRKIVSLFQGMIDDTNSGLEFFPKAVRGKKERRGKKKERREKKKRGG